MEIIVHGVTEFVSKLDMLIVRFPNDVGQDAGEEAADLVVKTAEPKIPQVSGRAARSVHTQATLTGAFAVGGEDIEYYPMLEYGGYSGRQLATYREVFGEGRYLEPSAKESEGDIDRIAREKLVKTLRAIGLEVT